MRTKLSIVILAAIVLVMQLSYVFHDTVEVSPLENRTMANFAMVLDPPAEDSVVYRENPADRFEEALKDQFPLREAVVQSHSNFKTFLANAYAKAMEPLTAMLAPKPTQPPQEDIPTPDAPDFERYPGYGYPRLERFSHQEYTLTGVGIYYRINDTDYVTEHPAQGYIQEEMVKLHADQFQAIMDGFPELKLYNYFVTQSRDTPWFNSYLGMEAADNFEFAAQHLQQEVEVARLTFEDFEDYKRCYFKSDHHWNHEGAYEGYLDVHAMLADDFAISEPRTPIKTWNFTELYGVRFRGSWADKLKDAYDGWDEFLAHEFRLGTRQTFVIDPATLEEIPAELGLWSRYKAGEIRDSEYYDHYIAFYGSSIGEDGQSYPDSGYMFKTVNAEPEVDANLLIVGDSTQRAYRDLLASHFATTVYMDYRIMADNPIDEIIRRYDIDAVLVGGLVKLWGSDEYQFTFSEGFLE